MFGDGLFYSAKSSLVRGQTPCGCSRSPRWSKEQYEHRLRKMAVLGSHTFTGWYGEFTSRVSSVTVNCPYHGNFTLSADTYLRNGRCPNCAKSGFKQDRPATIYVLKVAGLYDFTGYGISNNIEARLKTHRKNIIRAKSSIAEMEVFHTSGEIALAVEGSIKSRFDRNPQKIEGFKTEATLDYLYDDVVSFVEDRLTNFIKSPQGDI